MTCFYWALIFFFLFKIAYLDYKFHYIADKDILLAGLLTLIFKYNQGDFWNAFGGLCLSTCCSGLIYVYARLKYKYPAFGSGDVTLFLFLGSLVGMRGLTSWAILVSLLFLVTLLSISVVSNIAWKTSLPLAPLLNMATILWLIWENRLFVFAKTANCVTLLTLFP